VAAIALFVALTGAATAGTVALITGKQIKNGSIGLVDLSTGTKQSLHGSQGPQGPAGPAGAQGPAGTQGAAGPAGIASVKSALGPKTTQCPYGGGACQVATSTATCPPGSVVVGGGFSAGSIDNITLYAGAANSTSYAVIADNEYSGSNTIQAQAICAAGLGVSAITASVNTNAFKVALEQSKAAASK
jgi:hypothetical protein